MRCMRRGVDAPADVVPELEAAVWFEDCGCCRFSIFWSSFSLTGSCEPFKKIDVLTALAYGRIRHFIDIFGKNPGAFYLRGSELFMNSCSCL